MLSKVERSLLRVVIFASEHSHWHGRSGYRLGRLSNEQIVEIGSDLVRLFEERYEAEVKNAPPTEPGAPCGGTGGPRVRQRLRDQ